MASVAINAPFPASAHVKLYERDLLAPTGLNLSDADAVAHGTVGQDSKVQIGGLEAGPYWAVVDGQPPVAVTAKGGRIEKATEDRRTRERPTGDGDVRGDDGELVASLDDDTQVQGRDAADTIVEGDPKSQEAPVHGRDVVTGPRTSANTRIKAQASQTPEKSLTETVKETAKRATGKRGKR